MTGAQNLHRACLQAALRTDRWSRERKLRVPVLHSLHSRLLVRLLAVLHSLQANQSNCLLSIPRLLRLQSVSLNLQSYARLSVKVGAVRLRGVG